MYPVIFRIGPITVYSYGAMMALAFLVAGYVVGKELDRKGMDPGLASSIVLWALVGGLVGARALVIAGDLRGFLRAPLGYLLTGAGFIWYGGFLGGLVAVSWLIYRRGLPWLATTDCIAPGLALGHAIGRIGCQLAGDGDWGAETTLPWGMAYPNAIVGWDYPPGVRVHPAPLYETALYTAVFVLLWRLRRRPLPDGTLIALYFVLAGTARFFVEFVRIEPRVLAGLTQAQLISAALVAAGSLGLLRLRRRRAATP
jgi:phosphatidylglycerol:prolipoprotein diacylglycerol transferase